MEYWCVIWHTGQGIKLRLSHLPNDIGKGYAKLDELQRKEEDYHKTVWSKRKEFVNQWFELDNKNDRMISDIAQDDAEGE